MGLQLADEFVNGAGDGVEEFVHEFGLLHIGVYSSSPELIMCCRNWS